MSVQPGPVASTSNKGSQVIKAGFLRRFKKGFLSRGFKDVYVELTLDSHLVWFRDQCSYKQDGCIYLTSVCDFLAVGPYTRSIPGRPSLPRSASERHIIAVPSSPGRDSVVYWFLASSDYELNEWMTTISSVLPPLLPPKEPRPECPRDPPPPYSNSPHDKRRSELKNREGERCGAGESAVQSQLSNGDCHKETPPTGALAASPVAACAWGWTWGWGGGWGCGGWGCFDFAPTNHHCHDAHCSGGGGGDHCGATEDGVYQYQTAAGIDCDQAYEYENGMDVDNGYGDVGCDGGAGFDGFDAGGFDMGFSIGF